MSEPSERPSNPDTTELLHAWAGGDREALAHLAPRVYRELRRMAAHFLRNEHSGRSMESAELVHEVYLKLVDIHRVNWQDRAHFLAIAARLMRRILLDRARRRMAGKRGGALKVSLDENLTIGSERASELVALDAALETLASVDARKAQVVELRFFGGLSIDEIAFVVQVSSDTVKRDWKTARAWLLSTLSNRA